MKVSLNGLLDALRGGAWPPSARGVRCSVKSENERDLCLQLLLLFSEGRHTGETACVKYEEGVGHGRSVCPESSGLHATCIG